MISFLRALCNKNARQYLFRRDIARFSGAIGSTSFAEHLANFPPDDAETIIAAWILAVNNDSGDPHDPIEDDPRYEAIFEEVGELAYKLVPGRGRGHARMKKQQELLAERGIHWLSRAQINPWAIYD